jgi:phage N-6-adenine-methyltransferase
MPINKGLFTSKTDEWATPQAMFDRLNQEFTFSLDVCATPENAKCPRYFTATDDGLKQEWDGVCWMNPPYGRSIGAWVKKAFESSLQGATIVCLLPSRTDTSWWHDFCLRGDVRFIRGRVRFNDGRGPAPFPSAIVIFRPNNDGGGE